MRKTKRTASRREAAGSSPQVLDKSSGLVLLKGICRDARKRRQGENFLLPQGIKTDGDCLLAGAAAFRHAVLQ
jgi:hypothetical protein